MFSKNKWIISLLAVALFSVTACSATKTPTTQSVSTTQQTPMPPIPKLPSLALSQQEIDSNRQYIQSQIVQKDGKTKYFFDKENKDGKNPQVSKKVAGGFYRIVLGKTATGDCAVQDFYADTNQKQSEPLIVAKKNCNNFNTWGYDGAWILYDEKQNIQQWGHFKNGKMLNFLADYGVLYIDLADKSKTTIMMKSFFDEIFVGVYNNNQQIEEATLIFTEPKQNQTAMQKIRYVNGQADRDHSHLWVNGQEKPIEQDYFSQVSKLADNLISQSNAVLKRMQRELSVENN